MRIAFAVAKNPVRMAPKVSDELSIPSPGGNAKCNFHHRKAPAIANRYGDKCSRCNDFISLERSSIRYMRGSMLYNAQLSGSEDRFQAGYHQIHAQVVEQ